MINNLEIEKYKAISEAYLTFDRPFGEFRINPLEFEEITENIDTVSFNILTKEILLTILNRALLNEINRDDLIGWTTDIFAFAVLEVEARYADEILNTLVLLDQASPSFHYDPNDNVQRYFITDDLLKEEISKLENNESSKIT